MTHMITLLKRNSMIVILFIVAIAFAILTNGNMLNPQNINNLIAQNAYVIILTIGMLQCILTGGNVDLSIGSIVCLVGAVAGKLIVTFGINHYLAIVLCLATGIAIGAFQGFWIAYIRIPPFIVTLAGMMLWRGVALVVLDGLTLSPFPDCYNDLFNSYLVDPFQNPQINIMCLIVGVAGLLIYLFLAIKSRSSGLKKGVLQASNLSFIARLALVLVLAGAVLFKLAQYKGFPMILLILMILILAYNYYVSRCVSGRYLYAVGGNENAAKLSGVDTNKVYFKAYANMGFLSAVAALVAVARFNSAAPTAGTGYEMDAIGACFIGGASAYVGVGTVPGVIVGAIFMGVLNNGMSIMGIDSNWQRIVKGAVLLAAVAFDVISKSRVKEN